LSPRTAALLLALAILPSPLVVATWHGVGTSEPDTSYDVASGRMFTQPDTSPSGLKLYFDAFLSTGTGFAGAGYDGLSLNPNVGATGSRVAPAGFVNYRALLGVWKDCNGDGYVGLAEGALQSYRSTILAPLANNPCPVGSMFNDGQWVDEYLAIGMVDPCAYQSPGYREIHCPSTYDGLNNLASSPTGAVPAWNDNPVVLYANGTYVWGDDGAPGSAPQLQCALRPLPQGTTASTGGLLADADCRTGFTVARTFDAEDRTLDPSDSLQLYFADPTQPQTSSSRLDQHFAVTPFGDPQSGTAGLAQQGSRDPAFTAFDCSRPDAYGVADPTGGGLHSASIQDPTPGSILTGTFPIPVRGQVTVFQPDPSDPGGPGTATVYLTDGQNEFAGAPTPIVGSKTLQDPKGSYWDAAVGAAGGASLAAAGVTACDGSTANALAAAYPGALVESQTPPPSLVKSQSSYTFYFSEGYRGLDPQVDPIVGSYRWPSDVGVVYTRNMYGGPMWSAIQAPFAEPQLVDRSSLAPAAPRYATFYAMVPPGFLQQHGITPPRSDYATYGAENCGSATSGVVDGWQCDPARWWRDASGRDITPRYAEGQPFGQVVGAPYLVRDVDCSDGHVAASAYASLAQAGGGTCS
jgi:hypothetical protein